MRGLFIVFDGIDGCGKSTQLARAADRLKRDGHTVVTTREPGGTGISEKIRSLILAPDNGEMVHECELLLYAAARAQHVREKIAPALERGAVVLCDRFDFATFAYQGFGRQVPLSFLKTINAFASDGLRPDITFIFDIGVEAAFKRLAAIKKSRDRVESSGKRFFSRVAEGFRTIARENPETILLLDAEESIEALGEKVYRKLCDTMKTRSVQ